MASCCLDPIICNEMQNMADMKSIDGVLSQVIGRL